MNTTPTPHKPLELTIRKKTGISIHQQLVTQLAMQITSGLLPAGSKLPSVRQLSKKLGIHYNTCLAVYRKLEEDGLIEIRQGSGVKVAAIETRSDIPAMEHFELNEMARYFIKQALKRGYTWDEIRTAAASVHHELSGSKTQTLVWVDEHPNIIPVFTAELEQAFPHANVQGFSLESLQKPAAKTLIQGKPIYVVSRYHLAALQKTLAQHNADQSSEIIVVDVTGGREEADYVKQLPPGALMVIVSRSAIVLQQAEAVVAAIRGHDLLLRTVLHSDGPEGEDVDEVKKALRHGQFVLTDVLNAPLVKSLTKKPVHTLKLIPDEEVSRIRTAISEQ